jgi:hypothetical protein
MTADAPADRAAASRLVATQEHAWTAIRTQHPDVPQDVMVVASGSDPCGKRLSLGHFPFGNSSTRRPTGPRSWSAAKASAAARRRCPLVVVLLDVQAGGTATGPVVPATLARYCPSTATAVERYFLDLEIYSNEPIPASAGPA